MPYYYHLRSDIESKLAPDKDAVRKRTIDGLLRLRKGFIKPANELIKPIPPRQLDTLLLATWNIRELDSNKGGLRSSEALHYIAEVIDRFDLVAVQEIREDLDALKKVLRLLGPNWAHICTDVTLGRRGNSERMAYLYDKRKVSFGGLAGELVLPRSRTFDQEQFARTPYLCGFQCGWAKFSLCTVHIYYGKSQANEPTRVKEIKRLSKLLGKRTRPGTIKRGNKEVQVSGENLILLGDFNIFRPSDETMTALKSGGFDIPEALQQVPGSNVKKDKHYDQIAVGEYRHRMEATQNAGVFDFYDYIYRAGDKAIYQPLIEISERTGKPKMSFNNWRTHQMSDHLPMWQEFKVDFSDEYLKRWR